MQEYAIITAGGIGKRMGAKKPKQFLEIKNKPILQHTIDVFKSYNKKIKIILVLPMEHIVTWKNICEDKGYKIDYEIAVGGKERFDSIKQGLKFISKDGLVAIHDAVRPLVSEKTIKETFKSAKESGNAIPVMPVVESLRMVNSIKNIAVDRKQFQLVQTPQCFQVSLIKEAYKQNYNPNFTDDASVLEKLGYKINLVEGNRENIKITTKEDLKFAKAFM